MEGSQRWRRHAFLSTPHATQSPLRDRAVGQRRGVQTSVLRELAGCAVAGPAAVYHPVTIQWRIFNRSVPGLGGESCIPSLGTVVRATLGLLRGRQSAAYFYRPLAGTIGRSSRVSVMGRRVWYLTKSIQRSPRLSEVLSQPSSQAPSTSTCIATSSSQLPTCARPQGAMGTETASPGPAATATLAVLEVRCSRFVDLPGLCSLDAGDGESRDPRIVPLPGFASVWGGPQGTVANGGHVLPRGPRRSRAWMSPWRRGYPCGLDQAMSVIQLS